MRPWLESGDAPAEVLELLRAGRPARPIGDGPRERSRRYVAGLTALPAAAGTLVWLQHAAYGAVLGAAVTGTVTIAPRVFLHRSEGARAVAARPTREPPRAPILRSRAGPPEVPSVVADEEPLPPKTRAVARFEPSENDLAREAKSLERARALVESRPAEALDTLRRHRAEFPHGTLEIEREFLEVEALVRSGRRAEAEASADALRRRAPGSLYEGRLDRLMAHEN